MILEFKISNYRSCKKELGFCLEAESSKQKGNNIQDVGTGKQNTRVLKVAAIFGANASGKTNVIRALFEIIRFITDKPKVNERIRLYQPFLFDRESMNAPSSFELTFIGPSNNKYVYSFSINRTTVLSEKLVYYPNNRPVELFERLALNTGENIYVGQLGNSLQNQTVQVFSNQLLLSKFGEDPEPLLTNVFLHFEKYNVINAVSPTQKDSLHRSVTEELYNDKELQRKISLLIKAADTKIDEIEIEKREEPSENANPELKTLFRRDPYEVYAKHNAYSNSKKEGFTVGINIKEESKGSQTLYALGGRVLSTLQQGGVLVVDELDTSLHPFITKMIVMLFLSEKINKLGAQLVFTTHDISLMEKDFLRRDQIWLAEKNDEGITDLFSLQDFDGLREDTPFDKWYMAGKFGALPDIKSLEEIFEDEQTN